MIEAAGLRLLRAFDPETAHRLALAALPLLAGKGPVSSPRLRTRVAGLDLPNPVGLAAGFDKNAVALAPLMRAGFGFLEVGAATPRPQQGNPRPRMFRLAVDRAAINRLGFNNDGAEAIAARLARRPAGVPVGLNVGANRDSADRAADYARVIEAAGRHADFVTVNVSSPNTERLRDLQGPGALPRLLAGAVAAARALPAPVPVFLKISPDLSDAELAAVARIAAEAGADAVVATNTTVAREGLASPLAREAGGLSGRPLFAPSTRALARLARETGGAIPLIGVGGVASAGDALAKIRAGASAVQLYTALAFEGPSLAARIARGLDRLLEEGGHGSVADAVGTGVGEALGERTPPRGTGARGGARHPDGAPTRRSSAG